jgi:putative oxidoreductase
MTERFRDAGLLLLRVGMGAMFMVHGWPKIIAGPGGWAKLGAKGMGSLGIDVVPTLFGFAAAASEFFGGLLVALGLFFRPALALLVSTMTVAAILHIRQGDGVSGASHAIEAAIVFASLLLVGPGAHTLTARLRRTTKG